MRIPINKIKNTYIHKIKYDTLYKYYMELYGSIQISLSHTVLYVLIG